jgi:hypothetical protein
LSGVACSSRLRQEPCRQDSTQGGEQSRGDHVANPGLTAKQGARHQPARRTWTPHAPTPQRLFSVSFASVDHGWRYLQAKMPQEVNDPLPPGIRRTATSHRRARPLPRGVDGCHAS